VAPSISTRLQIPATVAGPASETGEVDPTPVVDSRAGSGEDPADSCFSPVDDPRIRRRAARAATTTQFDLIFSNPLTIYPFKV
jgi:hypothetical protein